MLNNGLGFSDEFELEACNYSEKSSSKLKHQYKEWTYAMRKEGSAFLKTVKSKVKEIWTLFFLLSLLLVSFRNTFTCIVCFSAYLNSWNTFCVNVMLIDSCVKLWNPYFPAHLFNPFYCSQNSVVLYANYCYVCKPVRKDLLSSTHAPYFHLIKCTNSDMIKQIIKCTS